MNHPIKYCYWAAPEKILAGEYPRTFDEVESQEKIDALVEAGVRVFVDLTTEGDRLKPYDDLLGKHRALGVRRESFPIADVSVPGSPIYTATILDCIDAAIENGETVYIHCWGGIGRTGVIVGCWLARHGEPGQAALHELKRLWQANPKSNRPQDSPETPTQEQYILDWRE